MFKRILSAAALAAFSFAPIASATPTTPRGLDDGHRALWSVLREHGVEAHVNPNQVCGDPSAEFMGVYFYAERADVPVLVVCQDNRIAWDETEVTWTANDLDTLRHEAVHYLQDCINGDIDMVLSPLHDGPGPGPGTLTYEDIIGILGPERATRIAYAYAEKGPDTVRLEHEAFAMAAVLTGEQLSVIISKSCPIEQ